MFLGGMIIGLSLCSSVISSIYSLCCFYAMTKCLLLIVLVGDEKLASDESEYSST